MTIPAPPEIPAPTTTLRPEAHSWAALAAAFHRAPQSTIAGANSFSSELGLPSGSLVYSGHQATFWHPGILAKRFAASAVAAKLGQDAHAVWLVVDQDATDATRLDLPCTTPDGVRSSLVHVLTPRDGMSGKMEIAGRTGTITLLTPALARPALTPPNPESLSAISSLAPSTRASLDAFSRAIAAASSATSQAVQVSDAIDALLESVAAPAHRILASDLSRTTLFRELCRRMLADPAACTRAYNQAVAEHPDAGLRPLECAAARIELPLWKLGATKRGTPRERVLASELAPLLEVPASSLIPVLLPRALLMTAMVRLASACIFIHGLGGEKYDPATERWLALWLTDLPKLRLAPAVIATASLYLKQEGTPPAATQRARNIDIQKLRRVRYDPHMSHDAALEQAKQAALAEIESHPRRSPQRRAAYIRLTQIIEQHRTAHAADVARAEASLIEIISRAADPHIIDTDPALRRDWPFFLYPDEDLLALRGRVEAAIGSNDPYHR